MTEVINGLYTKGKVWRRRKGRGYYYIQTKGSKVPLSHWPIWGVRVCPGDVSGTGYDPFENLSKAICEPTSNHSFVYCMTHHQIVHRIHNPVASPNIRSPSIRIKPTQPTTTTDRIATTHDPRPSRQATKRRRPPPQSRRRRKSHPRSLCKVYRPTEV